MLTFDVAATARLDIPDWSLLETVTAEEYVREHLHGMNPDWSLAEGITIHEVALSDRRKDGPVHRVTDDLGGDFTLALTLTLHTEDMDLTEAVQGIREALDNRWAGDPDESDQSWYPAEVKLWGLRLARRREKVLVFAHGDDDNSDSSREMNVDLTHMEEPHPCDTCGDIYDETTGEGYCGDCPTCADRKWAKENPED